MILKLRHISLLNILFLSLTGCSFNHKNEQESENNIPQPTEVVMNGIYIEKQPNKIDYEVGETFDPTGLEITVNWSDSSSETIKYSEHSIDFSLSKLAYSNH